MPATTMTSESTILASLDVSTAPRPWKNPNFKRTTRRNKTLKQILTLPPPTNPDIPTYANIEAPPSLLPQKKYCDVTGLEAKYTDPKTKLRYCDKEVYGVIKGMANGVEQQYLGLRGANIVLR
ncbi:chromatin-remodeling complex subunit ies6 [Saitoella coloradoensis]